MSIRYLYKSKLVPIPIDKAGTTKLVPILEAIPVPKPKSLSNARGSKESWKAYKKRQKDITLYCKAFKNGRGAYA